MYCAEFGDGSTSIRQLLLRFPKWVDDAAAGGREWNARLRDAANLVTMTRELDFTVRLVVAADRFERQIFLNSFCDDETALGGKKDLLDPPRIRGSHVRISKLRAMEWLGAVDQEGHVMA